MDNSNPILEKVAKLVAVSLMVRVIVEVEATDEQIWDIAKRKFITVIDDAGMDNLEFIEDDDQCLYDEKNDNPSAE